MPDLSGPLRRRNYGNNHGYQFGDVKIPGVTTIIGIRDKSALKSWAAGCAAELVANNTTVKNGHVVIDGDALYDDLVDLDEKMSRKPSRSAIEGALKWAHLKMGDRAAVKGTAVHALAEQIANGAEVTVPDELVGHVDAYLEWWRLWEPAQVITEFQCGSRRYGGWAGTGDLICYIDGLGMCLIDIKTSAKGVYGDTALQLAGYKGSEFIITEEGGPEQPMPEIDWCGVLWVRADGADLIPYRVGDLEYRQFIYCRAVYALWQEPFREGWVGENKPRYADSAWGDSVMGKALRPEDVRS